MMRSLRSCARALVALWTLGTLSCAGSPAPPPREPPRERQPVAPDAVAIGMPAEPPGDTPSAVEEPAALMLALVVDRSGSMIGLPIEMTLAALRAAIEELGSDDWVTVIAFDSRPFVIVERRRVGEKQALDEAIERIRPGGGTDILPALALGARSLEGEELPKQRHLLLMSDGQAPSDGLEELVTHVTSTGATISTVALGADADATLLRRIAELGRGRFHQVTDPRELPAVFRSEVSEARDTPATPAH